MGQAPRQEVGMSTIDDGCDEIGGPSTTWEWRRVKIRSAAPQGGSATQSLRKVSTVRLRRRDTHTLVIRYVGGPESCWLVRLGSRAWRAPGHMALEDLMTRLGLGAL